MKNIKKFISILNWVEPRFTVEQLKSLKSNARISDFSSLFEGKKKKDEVKKIYESVERCLADGYNIVCSLGDEYPLVLKGVFNCPVPLMYKGSLSFDRFNLSVVGSRKPQFTTTDWMKNELLESLKALKSENHEMSVLSGGAYGVDQMAHKVSLLASVPTICFLPTGINDCYPSSLRPLIESIVSNGGAVVSPFPPSFPIFKSNFYFRNKILVLLSNMVFIAEARRRSGTIMTANMAVSSGKSVVALPQAPIKNCLGSLDLIDSGVPIIRCKKDLIYNIKTLSSEVMTY